MYYILMTRFSFS